MYYIIVHFVQQPERIHQEMGHTNQHERAGRCGHIQFRGDSDVSLLTQCPDASLESQLSFRSKDIRPSSTVNSIRLAK